MDKCTHSRSKYTGSMPGTGNKVCVQCGKMVPSIALTDAEYKESLEKTIKSLEKKGYL